MLYYPRREVMNKNMEALYAGGMRYMAVLEVEEISS
jgi:hypothetical protein